MNPASQASERYSVLGRLGVGGMAEVLLARMSGPQGFQRLVVVKRLLSHLRDQRDHVSMFLDEARILARIRHRNVVTVHELLEDGDEYALVMEYLEGESSSAYLKRAVRRGAVDPWLGAHIASEAAAGLHAAHTLTDRRGRPLNLVHRDISPQNIFVTYSGEVKLLDFGVARADNRATKTESGVLKGKLAYMAPEQLRRSGVDQRADLFSLGAVIYELTTGTKLFSRDNELATVHAVCTDPIEPPSRRVPDYPPALERVVMRALERDPASRYQTADELRSDLRRALKDVPFDESPADHLAATMRALFEQRMERKREVVAQSVEPTRLIEEEIADVHRTPSPSVTGLGKSRIVRAGETRRRWGLIALGVGVVASVLGALFVFAWQVTTSSEAPRAAERLPPHAPAEEDPPPSTVRIHVVTDPPQAAVTIGEAEPCTAPCGVELTTTSTPIDVRGELEGYAAANVTIVPDHAQRLRLTLTALPPTPEPAPEIEDPTPTPSPAARRRRRRSAPNEPEPAFPVFN